jgi:hypothetical protein
MDELIDQMNSNDLHCGETEFYTLNKLHQPLLDGDVTTEHLEDLQNLYRKYLVTIDFQDGRDDTNKIFCLLNNYIDAYESKKFEKCIKISTQIYDDILNFLNVYEE